MRAGTTTFQHSAVSSRRPARERGFDEAGPCDERAHGPDVRRQVVGGGVDEVVEEAGADQRAERGLAQLDGALDEVDRGDVAWPYLRR